MNRNTITITAGMLLLLSQTAQSLAASSTQFSAASSAVAENAGEVLLSGTRTGDLETVVTVDYLTADKLGQDGRRLHGGLRHDEFCGGPNQPDPSDQHSQ